MVQLNAMTDLAIAEVLKGSADTYSDHPELSGLLKEAADRIEDMYYELKGD